MIKNLTKQVVFGQSIQDPGSSDQVTHGSRYSGGVDPDCHHGGPYIDVSQETVVFLKQETMKSKTTKHEMCQQLTTID